MSICDKCKRWNICRLVDGIVQKCNDYETMTNRDMLEKKIHEMSDEEFATTMPTKIFEKMLIKKKGKVERIEVIDYLSQPYEEEKKYAVYKQVFDTKAYWVEGDDKGWCGFHNKEHAKKYILQQANEKRNELNNKDPLANYMVEEV